MVRRTMRKAGGSVLYCYEAGPLGFTLYRRLLKEGFDCLVVAPSLIPKKPGSRVKTDSRDARELGSLLKADLLTEVEPPTEEEEAIRNLCRCRESVKRDFKRSRSRLFHFLLRLGYIYRDGSNWTQKHHLWLRSLSFDHDADQVVYSQYLFMVEQLEEQLRSMDRHLEEFSQRDPYREAVGYLRCFRGIDTVTAMTIAAELYKFGRFMNPRELMSFLGLTPGEHSSGDTRRTGSITKCGNTHVRRVLIEASWHYRHRPTVGITLRKRREGQPPRVISIADQAQKRLHDRFWALELRGKSKNKAVTAVARELVGFIWAALYDSTINEKCDFSENAA
jgi:transposase